MSKTQLTISGERFRVNGTPVYADLAGTHPDAHGLLMNARFIQGVFDDKSDPSRFARFGHATWDAEANTDRLIEALPDWHRYGLRAFTVGFQGGGPCFTTDNNTIDNNPFGEDGLSLDPAYAGRMDRLIRAADEIGMVVIVSYLYQAQARRIRDGKGIRNAVITASRFLRDGGYTNVMVEVANEHDVGHFKEHQIVCSDEGMAFLIELAREESGGMPTGCSGGGGVLKEQVARASDVVLIHGNGLTRQRYHLLIDRARKWAPGRPIVCNEDSQAIGQLGVALKTRTSWGYFNDMTKQEPPADWGVTRGEDQFFAWRMAMGIGIDVEMPPPEEQFYLQGFERDIIHENQRYIRLASLFPERIDHVDFFCDGKRVFTAWDEPFSVNWRCNWRQEGTDMGAGDQEWRAVVKLVTGESVETNVGLAP